MRAVWFDGRLQMLDDAPLPKIDGQLEALIKVRLAGICNTDLEVIQGYASFKGILGHEFVGEVVDGPPNWIDKRVVGEINIADGTCDMCRQGIPSQCRHRRALGIHDYDGVFADYVRLPIGNLHHVDETISDRSAVFTEPLAACLQILEQVHLHESTPCVVIGAGKLGLLAAQVLRLTCADVRVVVRHQRPAVLLQKWGIAYAAADEIASASVPIVVDCTGTASGLEQSLRMVAPRGTIVLKSTYNAIPQVDMTHIAVHEIRVIGSRCGPFEAALRMLRYGVIDVEPMIEAVYPLEDALDAFADAQGAGKLKVLLQP